MPLRASPNNTMSANKLPAARANATWAHERATRADKAERANVRPTDLGNAKATEALIDGTGILKHALIVGDHLIH